MKCWHLRYSTRLFYTSNTDKILRGNGILPRTPWNLQREGTFCRIFSLPCFRRQKWRLRLSAWVRRDTSFPKFELLYTQGESFVHECRFYCHKCKAVTNMSYINESSNEKQGPKHIYKDRIERYRFRSIVHRGTPYTPIYNKYTRKESRKCSKQSSSWTLPKDGKSYPEACMSRTHALPGESSLAVFESAVPVCKWSVNHQFTTAKGDLPSNATLRP